MYEVYCTEQLNHKYTQPMFKEYVQVKEFIKCIRTVDCEGDMEGH